MANSHTQTQSQFCLLLSHIRGAVPREEFRDVLVAEIRSILLHPVTAVRNVSERWRERRREETGERNSEEKSP